MAVHLCVVQETARGLITLKELEPLIEAKYRCVELTWEQQVDFAWDLASALSACA